jgi:uncharacterized protein (DUF433 family)
MTVASIELHPIPVDAYLERIGPDVIRVKGHRVGLEHIVERYQEGYSPEQMTLDFPGLDLAQIYGIIAYYLHNQAEVDAYVARVNARAEAAYHAWAANPSSATLRVRELRARRAQGRQP